MSRRVVILQRENDRMAVVAAALTDRGHTVVLTQSVAEATELVREQCGALLIDAPSPDCDDSLCGWVRREVRPMPTMVGVLTPEQEREEEQEQKADAEDHGLEPAEAGEVSGSEARRRGCEGCMRVLPSDTATAAIVAAVRRAVRWWPGDD
jgi:CheY-like chemotaxis protein